MIPSELGNKPRPSVLPVATILVGLLLAVFAASGCANDPEADHAQLLWNPGGGQLSVFPDDAFTIDDATTPTGLRVTIAPEAMDELSELPETFQQIFRDLDKLDGFGITAGLTLRFNEALDPGSLQSGQATGDGMASIGLFVETSDGVKAWPYELQLTEEDRTVILMPMIPLPPKARAFMAVSSRVLTADGTPVGASPTMAAALAGTPADDMSARVAERMRAAAQTYQDLGGVSAPEQIAGVVVFTTQSVHEDAIAIADDIRQRTVSSDNITCTDAATWTFCEGSFTAIDYRGSDGLIGDELDTTSTYELEFSIWLPTESPGPYGGAGYPVLVFGHGLGGGRDQAERLATFAAPRGMATIAIDAVRHGRHPTSTNNTTLLNTLDFFGISSTELTFEPLLMREHFRQSTYDKLQLMRLILGGIDVDGDKVVDLDPTRISYLGVSLGGIMGSEFLALAPEITAGVLVVPGGRVGSIVSDASQFSILIDIMKPPGTTDGEVDRFFPVLQTLLDRGDAAAWATHLLVDRPGRPAGLPAAHPHILMGMVLDDDTVPNSTNRALARALDIPLVPPMRQDVGIITMSDDAPVMGNLGDGRTAGLLQFHEVQDDDGSMEPATHSNIGDSDVGAEAWFRFLDTHLRNGTPTIINPYVELGLE